MELSCWLRLLTEVERPRQRPMLAASAIANQARADQVELPFTLRNISRQNGRRLCLSMTTTTLLEAAISFLTARIALWFAVNTPRQGTMLGALPAPALPAATGPPCRISRGLRELDAPPYLPA